MKPADETAPAASASNAAPTGAAAAVPPAAAQAARPAAGDTHTVAPGDSLSRIAAAHGVAVQELMRLNRLTDPDLVQVGRTLRLRDGAAAQASQGSSQASSARGSHTVAAGETLSGVAARYGIGMADLVRWNQLANADSVRAGQTLRLAPSNAAEGTLTVPAMSGTTAARRYQVQPGDTISSVAARHNVAQDTLIRANGLRDPDRLLAGTQLLIPASGASARRTS
jgi:LysM repeat protein